MGGVVEGVIVAAMLFNIKFTICIVWWGLCLKMVIYLFFLASGMMIKKIMLSLHG